MNITTIAWLPSLDNHPGWILAIASAVVSLLTLAILRLTVDRQALQRSNDKIISRTLELVLYRHDLAIQIEAVTGMLRGIGTAVLKLLPGLSLALVVFLCMAVMLEGVFDARPLKPGAPAIFKAYVSAEFPVADQGISLKSSENIAVETPALRMQDAAEINWRFRVKDSSSFPAWLELDIQGQRIRCLVPVENSRRSQVWYDAARHFGDTTRKLAGVLSLSKKEFPTVAVIYPPREFVLAGRHIDWLAAFLVMTCAFTIILKRLIS